ncbi:hypothetical protein DIPPA_23111 [Diplonema papillatum]|nr:hypothetical protein DIPPA_23111 [Diplonema papillatum]
MWCSECVCLFRSMDALTDSQPKATISPTRNGPLSSKHSSDRHSLTVVFCVVSNAARKVVQRVRVPLPVDGRATDSQPKAISPTRNGPLSSKHSSDHRSVTVVFCVVSNAARKVV